MITRWPKLFAKNGTLDPISWDDLFKEFSEPRAFLGDEHPGWSAAEFDPPQRKLSNVKSVHAVVLDYDSGVTLDEAEDTWAGFFGFIHTSRKNTPENHRFRVILPLSRSVSPFEYSALWERIFEFTQGKLDPAPKDASRFWYVPGIADRPGATFETRHLDGDLLDPDEWLTRELTVPKPPQNLKHINEDVAMKRAQSYLANMPPAVSGQHGHTALFNAVRKCLFGFDLTPDQTYQLIASEFNPRCSPPWSEQDIWHKINNANKNAKLRDTVPDRPRDQPQTHGNTAIKSEPVPDEDWRRWLVQNKQGITKDPINVGVYLTHHDDWRGCLEYDSFSDFIYWAREAPGGIGITPPQAGDRLNDHHEAYVQAHLRKYEPYQTFSKQAVSDQIRLSARQNSRHPLREYIADTRWDGVCRVRSWLHRYFGADDNEYVSNVGMWWLVSAIARVFRPGCQADYMLILEGDQGVGKSSAIRILGGEYYLGTLPDIRDRERAAHALQGMWLVEIGELDAMKGVSATRVKDFVSQTVDSYRKPWEREPQTRPRQCVFIGTTNDEQYLQDPTGARRFWPVRVRDVDREALVNERDQLIAEAYQMFVSGQKWWPDKKHESQLQAEQEHRYEADEWEVRVADWVYSRDGLTVGDILGGAFGLEPKDWDRRTQTRIGTCLRRLGMVPKQCKENGAKVRRYFKGGLVPEVGSDVF